MSTSDAVPNPTPEVKDSQDQAKETPPEETKKETTNTENDESKDRRSKNAKPRREGDNQTEENEIRVAAKGQIKNYLGYAFRILNKTDHKKLTIRATGNAIVKALILIELVKRRVGDLHQKNKIYSLEIKSEEDSKIPEGLVQDKEKTVAIRRVTAMDTELSKVPLDTTDPGYQPPEKQEPKPEPSEKKQEGEKTKKSGNKHKPQKLYNTPIDGEEEKQAGNKQRRDRNKNHDKHEDDLDNNQSKKETEGKKKGKKDKDAQKGDDHGGQDEKGKEDGKGKQNKKNRKQFMEQNLRNIIDDENPSKRRPVRGVADRRGHGDDRRGGVRNRYQGGYNNLHANFGPPMQHEQNYDQHGPRQGRDRRYYPRRGNDDFALQAGDRERRGPGGPYNQQNSRYNHYSNYEQNNDNYDRQYRHPRTQQYMYNDGGQPQMRYRDQPYREDRNQWRDGPQDYRGHPDNRMQGRGGGPIMREQRNFDERPRGEYERDRIHPAGGRDQEFHEDGPRQALSGHRGGRGRGDRGDHRGGGDRGGMRRYNAHPEHEDNEYNDHRGNRGMYRGEGTRGGFRGERGGDRGMERHNQQRFRGDRGGGQRARGGGPGGFDDSEHNFRGERGPRYENDGGNRGGNNRRGGYEDESGGHKIHTKHRGGHAGNQEAPQNTSD